jgi:predicted nucleic acid-binding protein
LLDTNHWSYLQCNHPNVLANIQKLSEDAKIYMPVVAQAELLVGIELAVAELHKQRLRAFAKTYNMILVTNDEHFQYIDGLQTED